MENEKALILRLVNNEYVQPVFKYDVNLEKLNKIPLGELALLGAAFSPLLGLLSSSNEIVENVASNVPRYVATDNNGNIIKLSSQVHGETGSFIGSYIKDGTTAQARFKEVPLTEVNNGIPNIDFSNVLIAAELMYIAKEINIIKQQQQNFFKYLMIEKRAEIEGSLSFLNKVLNDYKYNYQSQVYRISMHTKALDIKQEAEQVINASKKHIENFLKTRKENFDNLGNEMQSYQIALYTYAFSSFVEIIVLENLDSLYLKKVSDRLEELSIQYREIYTDCYNYLESRANKSPQSFLLETGSKIGKNIGEVIAKTPVGEKTTLDERIINSASRIKEIKDDNIEKHLSEFSNYRDTKILSFKRLIDALNMVNNNGLLFDSEYIYLPMV